MAVDRCEIVFFDLERIQFGQKWTIIEFGAILLCPQKLVELHEFCTPIRPNDLSLVSETSVKCKGITPGEVASAPKFEEVADKIYEMLNDRSWAGHNILSADCKWIREAFEDIGRSAPKPKHCFDSYKLLDQKFRSRAGDMKMATLANYFGLGSQQHRSLADVRMNIEILKSCATVLFLEDSIIPNVLPAPILPTPVISESPGASTSTNPRKRKAEDFLEHHEISPFSPEILEDENLGILKDPSTFSLKNVLSQWGTPKLTLLHTLPFRMCSSNMKIRYHGIFVDPSSKGKQRLSFVVEPSSQICNILKDYDDMAHNLFSSYNDKAEWKPLVKDCPQDTIRNIRINIATAVSGETTTYSTKLYMRDSNGTTTRFAAETVDINEFNKLLVSGRLVDAEYNFEIYDVERKAGICLVATKLTVGGTVQ